MCWCVQLVKMCWFVQVVKMYWFVQVVKMCWCVQVVKMLLIVLVTFMACTFPFQVTNLYPIYSHDTGDKVAALKHSSLFHCSLL